MMEKRSLYILLLFSITLSCVEPFEFIGSDVDKIVVIDALVSDDTARQYVNLSYARAINENSLDPLSGASVFVVDNFEEQTNFTESENGKYLPPSSFIGIAGRSYQLTVKTPEGNTYQSTMVALIPSPPIDSVYDKYVELPSEDQTFVERGIQFFVDTHDDSGIVQHFRYEWEEAFDIRVPYQSFYTYLPPVERPRDQRVGRCWEFNNSVKLIIATSTGTTDNRVSEFPLRFINGKTDILRNRYSILIRQFAVSQRAHSFYRKLKEVNEGGGTLFDQQQGAILGNITSLTNPNEQVLGYFEVSGVSTLRTFFNFRDLDENFPRPKFRFKCDPPLLVPEDSIAYYESEGYLLHVLSDSPECPNCYEVTIPGCGACDWYATTEKPNFWIY